MLIIKPVQSCPIFPSVQYCPSSEDFMDILSSLVSLNLFISFPNRNGVEVGSKACSIVGGTNSNPLWLGANHFGGSIKSFAFWNRALSAEEVAALDSSKLTCL